jgi:predicted RNA-binding protein associated with RNAse of E/G family
MKNAEYTDFGAVKLYRRRFIPDEKILLKDDVIVSLDDEKLVTKWQVLTKRHDFSHGVSCYFFNRGWKISRFLNDKDELVYWYCDIIETEYNEAENTYTLNDLLADVIIYPDGKVEVVDVDELALALRDEIIPKELVIKALDRLDSLLKVIYKGELEKYSAFTEV